MNPLPESLLPPLSALTPLQLAWLSGWCWARAQGQPETAALPFDAAAAAASAAAAPTLTVLSASQTGNARGVAAQLAEALQSAGVPVRLVSAADYKTKELAEETWLLAAVSTQGEGEPPEEAVSLFKFLFGKKAPRLDGLNFAVLGLGDSSYPKFCGAAADLDAQLAHLGGRRILPRRDCDLDYRAEAEAWIAEVVNAVRGQIAAAPVPAQVSGSLKETAPSVYNKNAPFAAALNLRQKITGRGSDKDVRHIELDLSGSGLRYQAGDALGVWPRNDAAVVAAVLAAAGLTGEEQVEVNGQDKSVREALIADWEIGQNTPHFVKTLAEAVGDADLAADAAAVAAQRSVLGLLQEYAPKLTAQQLGGMLRPLAPRLYSIASAQDEVGEEVHITVGVVREEENGQVRYGCASGYLAHGVGEDESVRVFVEANPHFRLPENPAAPVIMIGAGTGIAPFRAFMQQRAADGAAGKNWLIFGNPHFTEDFLYQTEWQAWAKEGYLHRYSFAWSRDQEEKVYVQDKIRAEAAELWRWLKEGAHVYVCGDAARMAKAVEAALVDAIAAAGGMDAEAADEYLDTLRQEKRYQRDVY